MAHDSSPGQPSSPVGLSLTQAMEERLQAEKLRVVGQLAGGIAHDFNNFLLLISFCTEQLLSQLPVGDVNRKNVTAISDAGSRAAGLTRQLLAFSQRQSLQLTRVDLNGLIVRADQVVRRLINNTITVTLKLTPTAAMVNIDPDQFEHVLLNLILNAQDAMPDGGRLTIETAQEDAIGDNAADRNQLPPQKWVRLIVSDTGCGMTEEVMSRMFEPYFTTKTAGKGTGLGLAVVHGIVYQLGGKISVQSTVEVGTTIEIRLPAAAENIPAAESACDHASHEVVPETILLVEDEANLRQLLKCSLESHGYKVLEARHGPAAIAAAVRHGKPIHLLLTDMELPEMSGNAVAQALRDDHPNLPTLFMSGAHGIELEETNCCDSFLMKPFKTSELIRRVREILSDKTPAPF